LNAVRAGKTRQNNKPGAFSSGVATGSREENATKQKLKAQSQFDAIGL
jgi:hypothetical protein